MCLPLVLSVVLAAAAPPTPASMSAEAALKELERHGPVEPCRVQESLLEDGAGRAHGFAPPPPVARLAGKAPEILPFLEHGSRKVVLRAAALACAAQGDEVPAALAQLADRYPCEEALIDAAFAFGHSVRSKKECYLGKRKNELFAPFFDLKQWRTKQATALAARLDRGDAAASAEAFEGLDALEEAAAREAAAALAAVTTPDGYLALVRAAAAQRKDLFPAHEFMQGAGGLALETMARRAKSDLGTALIPAIVRCGPKEAQALATLTLSGVIEGMPDRALAHRQTPGATPAGRAILERLASRTPSDRRGGSAFFAATDLVRARDRAGLRAYFDDEGKLLEDRFYAASGLAELGDPSGLALWESTEGLWPVELAERKRRLQDLSRKATGDAAAKARALLDGPWASVSERP
ncbi:MAG TPA: hypothetical protein VGK67_28020 [Myxococcales bacterium]|jgi:hypothetical protein